MGVSRRKFLQTAGITGAALAFTDKALALRMLQPAVEIGNPLEA